MDDIFYWNHFSKYTVMRNRSAWTNASACIWSEFTVLLVRYESFQFNAVVRAENEKTVSRTVAQVPYLSSRDKTTTQDFSSFRCKYDLLLSSATEKPYLFIFRVTFLGLNVPFYMLFLLKSNGYLWWRSINSRSCVMKGVCFEIFSDQTQKRGQKQAF